MRGKLDIQEGCCEKCWHGFDSAHPGVCRLDYHCPCHKDTLSTRDKMMQPAPQNPQGDILYVDKSYIAPARPLFGSPKDTTSMEKPYHKRDHTHCFDQESSPCGIKGKHRCCLCKKPVPSMEEKVHHPACHYINSNKNHRCNCAEIVSCSQGMEEKCQCEDRGYYYKKEIGVVTTVFGDHIPNCRFYAPSPSLPEWQTPTKLPTIKEYLAAPEKYPGVNLEIHGAGGHEIPEWSDNVDNIVWQATELGRMKDSPRKTRMLQDKLHETIKKIVAQAEKRTLEKALEALPKEVDGVTNDYTHMIDADGKSVYERSARIGFNTCLSQAKDSLNKLLTNHE